MHDLFFIESQGISSSGDDEIVIEYTEPAQTQSTTSLITKIQKPSKWMWNEYVCIFSG